MSTSTTPTAESCPIDPAARQAWLERAKKTGEQPPHPLADISSEQARRPSFFSSIFSFQFPMPYDARIRQSQGQAIEQQLSLKTRPLSKDREVSTIPRADPTYSKTTPNPSSNPSNHEQETGSDEQTGNWIYPSEKMFFDAMRRKNYDPNATDMVTIVPIHNAVNERAWKEIKQWERKFEWSRRANASCSGPRLHSFSGDSKKLSPRARWNMLWGYTEPFDRHDWVVERCPGHPSIEYVIDFYEGKSESQQGKLNFFLDVRPKLNTWEGWKMRMAGVLADSFGVY